MSLVAYGGSDESEDEEQESKDVPSPSLTTHQTSGHISDEEDNFAGVSSSTGGVSYPSIFSTIDPDTGETNKSEDVSTTSVTALNNLPAPRQQEIREEDEMPQETELEAEVLPKASELAEAPKPPKKQRQPARISIPSLNDVDVEEGSDGVKSKAKPSEKSSGLFSLLPAPVHSSKKEVNRLLIPHTLTKKNASIKKETQVKEISSSLSGSDAPIPTQQSQSKKDVSRKHLTTFNALTGYDSDSDDDENPSAHSFFSLGQNPQDVFTNEKPSNGQTAAINSTVETTGKEEAVGDRHVDSNETVGVAKVELGAINDAPLDFSNTARLHSWTHVSYSHLRPVGPSAPLASTVIPTTDSELNVSVEQSNREFFDSMTQDDNVNICSNAASSDDLRHLMTDKEFQRMHGKRKRGLEEEINFVDARVDDYVDPTEVSKHMTEETEYVSAKKDKDNMPTSQQKRKKQITYLAYQAKEKEFELKNTWAQNRLTKKQTQSKYGF